MKLKLILLMPLIIILTGCWNYRELNQIAIITSLAIDINDEDEYVVSVLIANGKNNQANSKEGQSQTVVYSGKGKSLSRAFKDINLQIPKIPYIGHLGVVVVSEDVAEEGMRSVLDYLLREPESVKKFYLIIAKDDKASDVIKTLSPLESFPGQSISTNISISNQQEAIATAIRYSAFVSNLLKKGKSPSLPTITIIGDPKEGSDNKNLESSDIKTKTKLGPIALFKKDKLVGFATDDESRGINLITDQIDEMIIDYECKSFDKDGYIVVNLTSMDSNMSISLENGKLSANVNVSAIGGIQELTCDIDLLDEDTFLKIQRETEKQVGKKIEKAIKVTKEYETDIFGFGNLLYKRHPKYFTKIDDWDDKYIDLDIDYKVDIQLKIKGSIEKSI